MSGRQKSLPVPYTRQLQGQWIPGQSLFIQGFIIGSQRFDVNLAVGPNTLDGGPGTRSEIALHEGKVVLNDFNGDAWGAREVRFNSPFQEGEEFDLRIRAHESHFEVFANGKVLGPFEYRRPLSDVAYISVVGDVELHRVSWEGRYYTMPFQSVLGDFGAGKVLYVSGFVDSKADRFSVNFVTSRGDTAFHFNPRFNEKVIVRNTSRANVWDAKEEREGEFSFARNRIFDIIVQAQESAYYVFVNGQPCCTYNHRIPLAEVKGLLIDGDIELQGVHW